MTKEENNVSSAEITAIYRSTIPELSGDTCSQHLVSPAGKERATAFINKYNYPLVTRKISLRAAYFFSEATRLLTSNRYDSCISLASGFSLLLYYIAKENTKQTNITYIDTDLPPLLNERNKRIQAIRQKLHQSTLANIQSFAFNIEHAYQQQLNLTDVFPNCHRPLFMIEGVSYFLTKECTHWLIEQIASYNDAAIIIDYWPDGMLQQSSLFSRVHGDLNQGMILEQLQGFWDTATMEKIRHLFAVTSDWSLSEMDKKISRIKTPPLTPTLLDPNEYFPLRLLTAEKHSPQPREI